MNEIVNSLQKSGSSNLGYIPSRDIVTPPTELMADESVKANFIPPISEAASRNGRGDFVEEYIARYDERPRVAEGQHWHQSSLFENTTLVLLAASCIIFFIFDLPIFRNMCNKLFANTFLGSASLPMKDPPPLYISHIISFVKSILFGLALFGTFLSFNS
jgi:hypothetical protein